MLPYSPLHHLLLADAGCTLVMTSGNVSDEPIAYRDDDALERLGADRRRVPRPRPADPHAHRRLRRARRARAADAPAPLARLRARRRCRCPSRAPRPCSACGAELKSTFCLAKGSRAWVGHHIGDLQNAETLASFRDGIAHFERLFDVAPEVVAHDLHPDYLSTSYALEREGVELVGVQHHHAHLAACLAEHGVTGRAVGAIFDGTGHGTDGTVWGGEILVGDLRSLRARRAPAGRCGCPAATAPRASRGGWRARGSSRPPAVTTRPATLARQTGRSLGRGRAAGATGFAAPVTTSMGRLFDAVAALCGVRAVATYEGQAAIELEAAADPDERGAYDARRGPRRAAARSRAVADDVRAGVAAPVVSARFHRAVADATADACAAAASDGGARRRRALRRRVPEPPAARRAPPSGSRRSACASSSPSACRSTTAASPTARRRSPRRRELSRCSASTSGSLGLGAAAASLVIALVVALLLGLRHATDPDHLTALSTLVLADDERGARRAGRLGLAWGAGHAVTLVALGLPVVLLDDALPDWAQRTAEGLIGVVIVVLAVRLLLRWRRGYFHAHPHEHGEGVAPRPPARPRARRTHAHAHAHEHRHAEAVGRSPRVGVRHRPGARRGRLGRRRDPAHRRASTATPRRRSRCCSSPPGRRCRWRSSPPRGAGCSSAARSSGGSPSLAPVFGTASLAFGCWYGLLAVG